MTQVRIVLEIAICGESVAQTPAVAAIEDGSAARRDATASPQSQSAGSHSAVLTVGGDNNTIVINMVMPIVESKGDSRNSSGGGE